jgi:hypothetical protein
MTSPNVPVSSADYCCQLTVTDRMGKEIDTRRKEWSVEDGGYTASRDWASKNKTELAAKHPDQYIFTNYVGRYDRGEVKGSA